MTIEELLQDGNWQAVFADIDDRDGAYSRDPSHGNCTKDTEAVGDCPIDPKPSRSDVAEIICSVDGENDGPPWMGVFLLKDGRYLFASGSCDYTGWD